MTTDSMMPPTIQDLMAQKTQLEQSIRTYSEILETVRAELCPCVGVNTTESRHHGVAVG
jgi:hypothetical protein